MTDPSLPTDERNAQQTQVAELAVHYFITDNKANVVGLVMAGSADFKTELQMSDLFDPRLLVREWSW